MTLSHHVVTHFLFFRPNLINWYTFVIRVSISIKLFVLEHNAKLKKIKNCCRCITRLNIAIYIGSLIGNIMCTPGNSFLSCSHFQNEELSSLESSFCFISLLCVEKTTTCLQLLKVLFTQINDNNRHLLTKAESCSLGKGYVR